MSVCLQINAEARYQTFLFHIELFYNAHLYPPFNHFEIMVLSDCLASMKETRSRDTVYLIPIKGRYNTNSLYQNKS